MAGGTPNHNRITLNLAGLLNSAFDGKSCEAFASDLRVQIDEEKHYTYPDIVVVCGPLEYTEGRKDTISNPQILMKILSDSTRDYDRGSKFTAYRALQSLREYILIEQHNVYVEHFFKNAEGIWQLREYRSSKDVLTLESVDCRLNLADVYRRVTFPPRIHILRSSSRSEHQEN